MATMARLEFGSLTQVWQGEATYFTPLLAEQLDAVGCAIGLDLASVGKSEVLTAGGRRIEIVAQGDDGSEFVIENQCGGADHEHLTRVWRLFENGWDHGVTVASLDQAGLAVESSRFSGAGTGTYPSPGCHRSGLTLRAPGAPRCRSWVNDHRYGAGYCCQCPLM